MPEPVTLAVLSGAALTGAVQFLYGQAADLLRRARDRRDRRTDAVQELPLAQSPLLDGTPPVARVDLAALGEADERAVAALRRELVDYVEGIAPVTPADGVLLTTADTLRQCLERVYGFRLTFRGEEREPTGTRVEASLELGTVAGYAAAVRAERISGAEVVAKLKAEEVGPTGTVVGVDARVLGRPD